MARWKQISGLPYEVSTMGEIRRLGSDKPMAMRIHPQSGYLEIQLRTPTGRRWFLAHRLVAKAFIPNPHGLPEVNHRRGNKLDIRASQLEWISREGNERHKTRVLCSHCKRPTTLVHIVEGTIKVQNITEFAERLGVVPSSVSAVINGRRPSVKGWRVAA